MAQRPPHGRWRMPSPIRPNSREYVANVLESRARLQPQAPALSLTRRQDLLELEMPAPDLSLYHTPDASPESAQ